MKPIAAIRVVTGLSPRGLEQALERAIEYMQKGDLDVEIQHLPTKGGYGVLVIGRVKDFGVKVGLAAP